MTTTPHTTTPLKSAGVIAHALQSIADHMIGLDEDVARDLPAPLSVQFSQLEDALVVHLRAFADHDVDAWVESMHIDEAVEMPKHHPDCTHTVRKGRLPNGVRVNLLTVDFHPVEIPRGES